jgi:hypothetical protein
MKTLIVGNVRVPQLFRRFHSDSLGIAGLNLTANGKGRKEIYENRSTVGALMLARIGWGRRRSDGVPRDHTAVG